MLKCACFYFEGFILKLSLACVIKCRLKAWLGLSCFRSKSFSSDNFKVSYKLNICLDKSCVSEVVAVFGLFRFCVMLLLFLLDSSTKVLFSLVA